MDRDNFKKFIVSGLTTGMLKIERPYGYYMNDADMMYELYKERVKMNRTNTVSRVAFSGDRTICHFEDGTKEIVKLYDEDIFDPDKAVAFAICKHLLGKKEFNRIFHKVITDKDRNDAKITYIGYIRKMNKRNKKH